MNFTKHISPINKKSCQSVKSNFSTFQLFNFSTGVGAALAVLCAAAALSASAGEFELLTNGAGTTLDGWTNTGANNKSLFGIFEDNSEVSWFGSERKSGYTEFDSAQLSQTVTLADLGIMEAEIQQRPTVTASVIAFADQGSTTCSVKVYELTESGSTIEEHVILNKAGENINPAENFSSSFQIDSGTRKLKYELNGLDSLKWEGFYGPKFRNCSLTITRQALMTLGDKQVMTVDSDTRLQGSDGICAIAVADGARAVINIKNGATLTVRGGNANGAKAAAPAIHVPESSTLYIVGDGTLIATGGNAANGGRGGDGSDGEVDTDNIKGRGGAGGNGGAGGGGGAPAIGGSGGVGGAGGAGGDCTEWRTCSVNDYAGNGNDGLHGSSGAEGGGMGKVVILGNVTVLATAGAEASSDGAGGSYGDSDNDSGSGWDFDFTAGGGGGGGGGARGQNAQYGIGGGGAGGAGGGGGGSGGTFCNSQYTSYLYACGGLGYGATSYNGTKAGNGSIGGAQEVDDGSYGTASGGTGGDGGSANTTHGSDGTFQALSSISLTVSPSRTAAQPVVQTSGDAVSDSITVTFMSDGTSVGTASASLMFAPPAAPPVSKSDGVFCGYYTDPTDGTKIYDADRNPVYPVWQTVEDTTLYARWLQVYTLTFVSQGGTVGMGDYTEGGATPIAPIPTRAGDYIFLGYYTENGVQAFDENGAFVNDALSGQPSNVKLYARWGVPEGSIAKLVYRGQLDLLAGGPAASDTTYTKKMHFRVYDSSESTTPLWTTGEGGIDVTVNKDGSFVQVFGDDTLAELLATGTVTHVGLAIGDSAMELKPRRELRPVAAVNRALTAEGAALDIRIGNLVTDNAIVAADATVSQLEVTGRVTAPGAGKVAVSPLTVGDRERTRLMRGAGVKAFSAAKPTVLIADTGAVLRGAILANAPSDGIALITSKAGGERALRCPAVVQYCRAGESVRAPTSDSGGLKVTFFPFIGKEGR